MSVARAWVDCIVGTTVPRGVRWPLGGGSKKRRFLVAREVVNTGRGNFFVQTEAMFGLWDSGCANGKSQKPLSPRGCSPASLLRTAICADS